MSECHHCKCILGTIVCHQHKCPLLTCVHTVTLPGHCCPICRDQYPFITNRDQGIYPIETSDDVRYLSFSASARTSIRSWSFNHYYLFNTHIYPSSCYSHITLCSIPCSPSNDFIFESIGQSKSVIADALASTRADSFEIIESLSLQI